MWTETTRKKYARCGIRYASDMTDGEWRLIEPLLPSPRRLGRPRTTNLREVVNALLYIAETGCQWRMVPKEFSPYSTVVNGGAKLVHPGGAKLVHLRAPLEMPFSARCRFRIGLTIC